MGYFPCGRSAGDYEEQWCSRCVHRHGPDGDSGCAVFLAHLVHNYKECQNAESILNLLIPRSKDGLSNDKCLMFKRAAE